MADLSAKTRLAEIHSCIAVTTGCSNTSRPCSIIWSGAGRPVQHQLRLLLYDLTAPISGRSAVCESDKATPRLFARSPADYVQVVIALVVTRGLPLPTRCCLATPRTTPLARLPARIERQYGKARRIWLMDRGIPTEVVLAKMRGSDPPVQYLVGTPKGA